MKGREGGWEKVGRKGSIVIAIVSISIHVHTSHLNCVEVLELTVVSIRPEGGAPEGTGEG